MNKMSKHKKQMAERFLNHALGIIYLLTGEEYTIVKKNSAHRSIQRLTGEVPIMCDDVAVYFSMEEWEYIEGHEELFKDVMKENRQTLKTVEIPAHESPGHSDNNLDIEPVIEKVEDEQLGKTIPHVETHSDLFAGEDDDEIKIVVNTEQTDLCVAHQMGAEHRDLDNTGLGEENGDNMLSGAQTEEEAACVRRHLIVPEQNICNNICTDDIKTEIILNTEQSNDLCIKSDLDAPVQEVCDGISIGEHGSLNQEDEILDVYSSQRTRGANNSYNTQHSQREVSNYSFVEPILCAGDNFESIFASSSQEQQLCLNNNFDNESDDVLFHSINFKNEDLADCTKQINKNVACESYRELPTEEKQYICQKCGKGFSQNSQRSRFSKHGVCQECAKVSSARSNLVTKQITHTGRTTHLYQKFGKGFSFKSHPGIHTGEKTFVCRECGKGFSARSSMLKHQQVHRANNRYGSEVLASTGEKTYVCHVCGKDFPHMSVLITHHRTHTGERPFTCQQCGRAFAQSGSLVRHQIVHTGAKPYVCQKCGKAYTRRTYLMMHQKKPCMGFGAMKSVALWCDS